MSCSWRTRPVRGCTGKTNVQPLDSTAEAMRRSRSGAVFAARWRVSAAYGFGYVGGVGGGRVEVEPVAGLRQLELLVEDVGELGIPVLAGVEADLLDARVAQRGAHGTGLDELRTVPDDREDLHGGEATMARRSGR